MKVSSPIGDLPFEPRRLAVKGKNLEISGLMGAWPAHVRVGAEDLPALLRLVAKPALLLAAVVLVLVPVRRAGARPRNSPGGKR